jgi:hypothetical protein
MGTHMADIPTILGSGTAKSIGAAIAAGKISSVQATRWYLERIEKFNGGENGINCVRMVSPLALEQAGRADAELGQDGAADRCTACPTSSRTTYSLWMAVVLPPVRGHWRASSLPMRRPW